jgi:hypothetical protein
MKGMFWAKMELAAVMTSGVLFLSGGVIAAGAAAPSEMASVSGSGTDLPANTWVKLEENGIGRREATCVVYIPGKDYVLAFGGRRGKKVKQHPYSEMTLSLEDRTWKNKYPEGQKYGPETGNVKLPGWKKFKRGRILLEDKKGVLRPYLGRYSDFVGNGYAYAYDPKNERVLVLGKMSLSYDVNTGKWKHLKPEGHPGTPRLEGIDFKEGTTFGPFWSQAVYDPDKHEVLQFGGACVLNKDSRPGTWIYDIDENKWRRRRPGSDALKALSQTADTVKKKTLSMIAGYRNRYYRTELKKTAAVPLKDVLSSRLSMKDFGSLFEQLRSSAGKVDKHEVQQLEWAAEEITSAAKSYKAVLDSADGGTDKSVLTNQLMEVKEWVRRLRVSLSPEPPARCYAPMAYSPDHKTILMFGGYGLNHVKNDTWVYDTRAQTWQQFRPEKNPLARFGHACVYLPDSGTFAVVGGQVSGFAVKKGSSFRTVNAPDAWRFDPENNKWQLIKRWPGKLAGSNGPLPPFGTGFYLKNQQTYAMNEEGVLVTVRANNNVYKTGRTSTWACRLDAGTPDPEGTEKYGVGPWAFQRPDNMNSAEWYDRTQPEPDPEEVRKGLKNLPENKWVKISRTPVYIPNWAFSSVQYSAERDELYAMTGGHATYHGSAIFRYSMKTDRWHRDYDAHQGLTYRYFTSHGSYAYDWCPFMRHYYDAYGYDPDSGMVMTTAYGLTPRFNPATGAWLTPETRAVGNKRSMVYATSEALYVWADRTIYRYKSGEGYQVVVKDTVPEATSADRAFFTYDTKRNCLVYGSTHKHADVFTYNLETGERKHLKPANRELMKGAGMLREFEYIPSADLVFDMKGLAWDPEENKWIRLKIDTKAVGGGKTSHNSQGMVYDPNRDLIWAASSIYNTPKTVTVLKLNAKTARQE